MLTPGITQMTHGNIMQSEGSQMQKTAHRYDPLIGNAGTGGSRERLASGCQGWGSEEVPASWYGICFWGNDANALESNRGDGCTTLSIPKTPQFFNGGMTSP